MGKSSISKGGVSMHEYSMVISSSSVEWAECLVAAFKDNKVFSVVGTSHTSEIIEFKLQDPI